MTTKHDQPLSVVRGTVFETTAGTLVENPIRMPVNPQLGLIMRVWKISSLLTLAFDNTVASNAITNVNSVGTVSMRQGLLVMPQYADPGVLTQRRIAMFQTTPAGLGTPTTPTVYEGADPSVMNFFPNGILLATANVSLYVEGEVGSVVTIRFDVDIWYTLQESKPDEVLAALSLSETF